MQYRAKNLEKTSSSLIMKTVNFTSNVFVFVTGGWGTGRGKTGQDTNQEILETSVDLKEDTVTHWISIIKFQNTLNAK